MLCNYFFSSLLWMHELTDIQIISQHSFSSHEKSESLQEAENSCDGMYFNYMTHHRASVH